MQTLRPWFDYDAVPPSTFAGIVEEQADVSFTLKLGTDAGEPFLLGHLENDPRQYMCPKCGTPGLHFWYRHSQVNCANCPYWGVLIKVSGYDMWVVLAPAVPL